AAGASTKLIGLMYAGADHLALDRHGNLRISTAAGTLVDAAPVSYPVVDGHRVEVSSRVVLRAAGAGRLGGGAYDASRPLIIDPGLAYSTYLGGSGFDISAKDMAVDAAGNAYITGRAQSLDFPVTVGAYQTAQRGSGDAFVTKLNASGTGAVYST